MEHSETETSQQRGSVPPTFSREWLHLLGLTIWIATKDLFRDHGPSWAASIAYYALFSVLPLILLTAIIASFFVEPNWAVDRITTMFGELIPVGEEEIEEIVHDTYDGRRVAGFVTIVALLWAGTQLFAVMTLSLNIAFDVPEMYGWIQRYLVDVLMLLTLGMLIVIALTSVYFLDNLLQITGIAPEEQIFIFQAAQYVLPFVLVVLSFFLIYRFVPRRRPNWKPALSGALLATVLFFVAQWIFLVYVERFADFEVMYGPIALLIILIFWFWIGALILLYGGELVSHFQDVLVEGMDPDEVEARHEREEPTREAEEQDEEDENKAPA